MNVYNFDKTIYKKNSSISFYLYCLGKNISLIRFVFLQLYYCFLYVFNFIDKTTLKSKLFCFLKGVKDAQKVAESFWQKNKKYIAKWYLEIKKETDVIVSSAPEFLLLPICKILGVNNLLASKVDIKTGEFYQADCSNEESVNRFKSEYGAKIDNFYSYSLKHGQFALLATNAFIVRKNKVIAWQEYKPSKGKKIKEFYLTKELVGFITVGAVNTINGFLFATLFSQFLDANLSFVLGYVVAINISYLLNSFLVFKSRLSFKRLVKFCLSYVPNFIIQNGLLFVFYNLLSLPKLVAYLIAVYVAIPITFLVVRLFAFNKKV